GDRIVVVAGVGVGAVRVEMQRAVLAMDVGADARGAVLVVVAGMHADHAAAGGLAVGAEHIVALDVGRHGRGIGVLAALQADRVVIGGRDVIDDADVDIARALVAVGVGDDDLEVLARQDVVALLAVVRVVVLEGIGVIELVVGLVPGDRDVAVFAGDRGR